MAQMGLSTEDELRLQVLLAQNLDAIHIDEAKMTLYALADGKELQMQLHPSGSDAHYLKSIRQFLSSHFLGSPVRYPVYLKRWIRMGQIDKDLKNLLLLAEPEAVKAVIHAPSLTESLARLAWWVAPQAENARKMLANPTVADSPFAEDLSQFLLDYMPFETHSGDLSLSVSLVLQQQSIDQETRMHLWSCGEQNIAYRIGFLLGACEDIPLQCAPHPDRSRFGCDEDQYGAVACYLKKVLSQEGQAWLATLAIALRNAQNQEDMIHTFSSIRHYFQGTADGAQACHDIATLEETAEQQLSSKTYPDFMQGLADAVARLALVNETLLDKPFATIDAVGSLMRRKLLGQTQALEQWIEVLCWEDAKKFIAELDSGRRRKLSRDRKPFRPQ